MARSKKTGSSAPRPVLVAPESTPFDPEPPAHAELAAEPATAQILPEISEKARPGRPKMRQKLDPGASVWDQIAARPKEEWLNRHTYVYLYRKEPFNAVRSEGESTYEMKYFEAIDIDTVMRRHGSGKYYLMLKTRPQGAPKDVTVGDLLFTIRNAEFPPVMSGDAWKKDSRNADWVALLPKEAPKLPEPPSNDPTKMLDTFLTIQDRISERMQQPGNNAEPQQAPATQLESLVNAASRIAEMTGSKETPGNGTAEAISLAEKIVTMRTENPMVTILTSQIERLQQSLERQRETQIQALQAEISALKANPNPAKSEGDFVETLNKLANAKETISKLLGINPEAAAPIRSRMPAWMEFARDIVPEVLHAPIVNGIANVLMQPKPNAPTPGNAFASRPAPGPIAPQNPATAPPPAPAPNDTQELINLVQTLTPAMLGYLRDQLEGSMFASWMNAGFEREYQRLANIEVPMLPGQKGAPVIVAFYRQSPHWQQIMAACGGDEAKFTRFIEDFCHWNPERDTDDGSPTVEGQTFSDSEEEGETIEV